MFTLLVTNFVFDRLERVANVVDFSKIGARVSLAGNRDSFVSDGECYDT